jgi:hypothetical protein
MVDHGFEQGMERIMGAELKDALADADRLYQEYVKLAELGQLGSMDPEPSESVIVASVSPVLIQSYANGIVG